MKHRRGRIVEVDTVEDLDRRWESGARDLDGWRFRSLDLRGDGDRLARGRVAGAMFLGCVFDDGVEAELEAAGAIVFPALPDTPVNPYRSRLYTAEDLYGDGRYTDSLDARAYAWTEAEPDDDSLLAATLHDHAVDSALAAWARPRSLVGVMGGHALRRGDPAYVDAARLGRLLGQDHTVATGGGPGAMEAANLGATLAGLGQDALDDTLAALARVPDYRSDVGAWAGCAFDALARVADRTETLGIPTWHYGHEPPNVCATAIAKYVRNAVREAVLLQICDRGIVFLPGAAGTVQEVFQDACENYYADPGAVAPMVLVGRRYWTETLPVWPLLQALAEDRTMAPRIHLVDDVEEAALVVSTERATAAAPPA
ncbi:MAG: LOG family protein [Nocardioides sp.]